MSTASRPVSFITSARLLGFPAQQVGPLEVAEPQVRPAGGARVGRAHLASESIARARVGEALLEGRRAARLDPLRELDQQPGARPLVRVRVEGDVEALGARIVDEGDQLVRTARVRLAVVEVGDVARRPGAPADLDGLLDRVEKAVAERVPDVGVVEAAELAGGVRECRQLLGGGEAARRVVEARRQPDGAVGHRVAQHAAHVVDRPLVGGDVVPAERVDAELAVADERADVEADGAVIPSEVVGHGAPVVVDVRTAIEPGVEVHERVEILLPTERREAVAVDADDLGGDTLADLGFVAAARRG